MKTTLALVSLGLLFGCYVDKPGDSQGKGFVRSYDSEKGMQPGVGYKDVLEDTAGVCVKNDGTIETDNGQEVFYKMEMIENHQSLAKAFSLSSATQVKAVVPDTPVQVSAKSKFAYGHTRSINSYSVTLLVSTKIKNETEHLKGVEVIDSVKEKLAKDLENTDPNVAIDNFRIRCGDSFLSGYTTGGEFYGIIEVQTDSDEEKRDISSELSASIGLMGVGDASSETAISRTLSKISKNHKISAWSYQLGGMGDQSSPAITVDEMLKRLKSMTTSVMNGENPRKITATFSDYFTLGLDMPTTQRNAMRTAQRFIAKLALFQSKLLDSQSNIDYALSHPNSFVGVDSSVLAHLGDVSGEIDEKLGQIYELALACEGDLTKCSMPTSLVQPNINFPVRKKTTQALDRDYIVIKTDQHSVDVSEIPDGWFNAPECYVKVVIGANKKGSVVVRRSATVVKNRCAKLDYSWKIPISLIESTMRRLGATLDETWIDVVVMEDDTSYDDRVASNYVWYKNVDSKGAEKIGINTKAVNMTVDFEVH